MELLLTEEQRLLKESAERFVAQEYSFDDRRARADSVDGFGRDIWAQFAELGWLALPFAEADGGLGGSLADVAIVMEAFGSGLVLEPYLPSVVLGGGLVADLGSADQKAAFLAPLIEGSLMLSFAGAEPEARFNLADVATEARTDGGEFVLSGRKCVAFNAGAADRLIVTARTAGDRRDANGVTLFLVDPAAGGVTLRPYRTVDGLRAADVVLDGVHVAATEMLGEPGAGMAAVDRAVDRALVALCAEAVGAMGVLVAKTQEYLKTRTQFGVPIGAFQVLQHRVVDMFTEQQLCAAMTRRAAITVELEDGNPAARARAASAAKARIGRAANFVGQQAVQLHGAIAMTDELDVGHYFKRLTMIDATFGDAEYHRARFAES